MTSFKSLVRIKSFLFLLVLSTYTSCNQCNSEDTNDDMQDEVDRANEAYEKEAKEQALIFCDSLFKDIEPLESIFALNKEIYPNSEEYRLKRKLIKCWETTKKIIEKKLRFSTLDTNILKQQENEMLSLMEECNEEFKKVKILGKKINNKTANEIENIKESFIEIVFNYILIRNSVGSQQGSIIKSLIAHGYGSKGLCHGCTNVYSEMFLKNQETDFLFLMAEAISGLTSGFTVLKKKPEVRNFLEKILYYQYLEFDRIVDNTRIHGQKLLSDIYPELKDKLIIPNDYLTGYSLEEFKIEIKKLEPYNFISEIVLSKSTDAHAIHFNKKNGFFTVYDPNSQPTKFNTFNDAMNYIIAISRRLNTNYFSLVDCIRI